MNRARIVRRASTMVLAIAAIGCGPGGMPASLNHPLAGIAAPAFAAVSTSSRDVGIPARVTTKVTVIDFWASWCEACQESLPMLDALWKRHHEDGLMVIGVSVDENEGDATATMNRYHATFPVVVDPSHRIAGTYGVAQIPMTFVVDRSQRVRWVGRSATEARRAVEVVLAE